MEDYTNLYILFFGFYDLTFVKRVRTMQNYAKGRLSPQKIGKTVVVALLFMGLALVTATTVPTAQSGGGPRVQVETQLAMILDGSGSINDNEWNIMINGLADAVENDSCIPHDGSVELTVVQFGGASNWFSDDEPYRCYMNSLLHLQF